MEHAQIISSPIGDILITSDEIGLTGLYLRNSLNKKMQERSSFAFQTDSFLEDTKRWLTIYFSKKQPDFTPKISLHGSSFAKEVWTLLKDIPYGTVCTYGDLAKQIAKSRNQKAMSSQAIGQAVSKNPIPIIIPCHRVIGAKNQLTGYALGLDLKVTLLALEQVDTSLLRGMEDKA